MTPENGISEHWLLRGAQSAFFYYISCGPCIVVETKYRRKKQARQERKIREKRRKERMEYRQKQREGGEGTETGEDDDDDDNVIELEVTDPAGTSRLVGVGLSGNKEEHIFLPFEVNEYWGDECSPDTGPPWWWKRLSGQDSDAVEPPLAMGARGVSRKRFFRPSGDHEWQEKNSVTDRDDADLYPLNDSHPPILCKGEILKEDVAWIKEPAPSTDTMRRIHGEVFEVDLDVLGRTANWKGDISNHPAVRKVDFETQLLERRSTKSSRKSSSSLVPSPKPKPVDSERKGSDVDGTAALSLVSNATGNRFLLPPAKAERSISPTARPDSAISSSRLKGRSQSQLKRIRSGSHTGSSASEDADDEDEEIGEAASSPKSNAITKPKATFQRSGKGSVHSQHSENLSPRNSPRTMGSAISSSESLTGEGWLSAMATNNSKHNNASTISTGPTPLK